MRFGLNQKGFTLIELISVMIIMGVMSSVAVKKFDIIGTTASEKALESTSRELNIRESLTWTNIKFSSAGWANDTASFAQVGTNLGADFVWTSGPNASGGTLRLRSYSIASMFHHIGNIFQNC
ncbi:MAG: prepilin-type N-terminal cleavage/methylation domain-containing protein [Desulfobacterales bacterium]|nr:prepilin-type N-terminal cleavage/methylation domain-containing protein [Desulfobacterales bacterium]